MKRFNLPAPALFFIISTRAMLGAGIGLLVSDRLGRKERRRIGAALVSIGALATIPALFAVFTSSSSSSSEPQVLVAAS
jgi:Na+-driven multidrug efflux pump